jgi:hypothetical protein
MLHAYQSIHNGPVGGDNWGKATGYTFFGKPDATSWGDQRVDVFSLGSGTNVNVLHKAYDHGTVYGWESYGAPPGGLASTDQLTATSWGPGRIDLWVYRPQQNKLWHAWSTSGAPQGNWDDWTFLLGGFAWKNAGIDSVSWGDQRLDVFGIGTDNVARHIYWDHGVSGQDSWGNPASNSLGRIAVARGLIGNQLTLLVQDSSSGPSGPYLFERWWAGAAYPWAQQGANPEANVQFLTGGYDKTGPWLSPTP